MKLEEATFDEVRAKSKSLPFGARLARWFVGGDTGLSSRAIAAVMQGGVGTGDYPCDSADFGRCYRLLKVAPHWRRRIAQMADTVPNGKVWAELAREWPKLTKLFEAGQHDGVYRLIKTCERRAGAR